MKNSIQVSNPFQQNMAQAPAGGALAASDHQRQVAEVQAAMILAKSNPRDQVAAMDRILNACARPTLAESALYSYARGGSEITGPSIRLAEAIAQQWGNIQFGMRELDQSGGESTVMAYAWDVETNTRKEIVFQVPHVRHTRKGRNKLEDPRDVYEMVANNGARRLRACILSVIPGDVIESAVNQCEITLTANADTSPAATQKMITAFEALGVTKKQLEKRIQRRIDTIRPAQVLSLRKIYASIRDGMSSTEDWFEEADDLKEALNRMGDGQKEKEQVPKVDEKLEALKTEAETIGVKFRSNITYPSLFKKVEARKAEISREQAEAKAKAPIEDDELPGHDVVTGEVVGDGGADELFGFKEDGGQVEQPGKQPDHSIATSTPEQKDARREFSNEISGRVSARYADLIQYGVKRTDLNRFVTNCMLTADNIDAFMDDHAGILAAIDEFYVSLEEG